MYIVVSPKLEKSKRTDGVRLTSRLGNFQPPCTPNKAHSLSTAAINPICFAAAPCHRHYWRFRPEESYDYKITDVQPLLT
jgi:hypothetical protein